jgi:hypothetical protein
VVSRETDFRRAPPVRRSVYELPIAVLAPRRGLLAFVVLYVLVCDAVIYHELASGRHGAALAMAIAGALIGLVKLRQVYRARRAIMRFTLDPRMLVIEHIVGDRARDTQSVARDELREVAVANHLGGYRVELHLDGGAIAIEPTSRLREPLDAVRAELVRFLAIETKPSTSV